MESPKRNVRDSGYIDCWDSERSDSLSPPRHGRDDSFDSLDSFGSRSQQTPSPDVVIRGSSDGERGCWGVRLVRSGVRKDVQLTPARCERDRFVEGRGFVAQL